MHSYLPNGKNLKSQNMGTLNFWVRNVLMCVYVWHNGGKKLQIITWLHNVYKLLYVIIRKTHRIPFEFP
jgi:hypothetical protein